MDVQTNKTEAVAHPSSVKSSVISCKMENSVTFPLLCRSPYQRYHHSHLKLSGIVADGEILSPTKTLNSAMLIGQIFIIFS